MSKSVHDRQSPTGLETRRYEILRVAARHPAYNVRLYGSVARGDAKSESDNDIFVDLEPGRSLLDLGGLQMELQDLLGRPVAMQTSSSLHEDVRKRLIQRATWF